MPCKGICKKHKVAKGKMRGSYYELGAKRCQICEVFIKWEHNWHCPCCGCQLRGKPRAKKYKERLEKIKKLPKILNA